MTRTDQKGVRWCMDSDTWAALVMIDDGSLAHRGTFPSRAEALQVHAAAMEATTPPRAAV
jgi:hypothetical protein